MDKIYSFVTINLILKKKKISYIFKMILFMTSLNEKLVTSICKGQLRTHHQYNFCKKFEIRNTLIFIFPIFTKK